LNKEKNVKDTDKTTGGPLTKVEILERLKSKDKNLRIFFTPMIDINQQLGPSAIDVRLGTQFIIFKRTRYPILDVCEGDPKDLAWKIGRYQEKLYIPLGRKIILHPQQLVLGSTLEYVRLPSDLMAELIGRSSWGRLGLIISAATLIHSCYAGVITLELANEGDTPIALYPGVRIAQLVFHKHIQPIKEGGLLQTKYIGSVEPSFSRLHEDEDLSIIRRIKKVL
jgi:dCTP deaminase